MLRDVLPRDERHQSGVVPMVGAEGGRLRRAGAFSVQDFEVFREKCCIRLHGPPTIIRICDSKYSLQAAKLQAERGAYTGDASD